MPAFKDVTVSYNGSEISPAPLIEISSAPQNLFVSNGRISLRGKVTHFGSSAEFGYSGMQSLKDSLVDIFRTDLGTLEIKRGDTSLIKKTCQVESVQFEENVHYNEVPYSVDLSFPADHPSLLVFGIPLGPMPTGDGSYEKVVFDYHQKSDGMQVRTGEVVYGIALDNYSTVSGVEVYRNGVRQASTGDWDLAKGIDIIGLANEATDTFRVTRSLSSYTYNTLCFYLGTGFYSTYDLDNSLVYRNGQLLRLGVDYEQSGHFVKPLFSVGSDSIEFDFSGTLISRTDEMLTAPTNKITVSTGTSSGCAIYVNGQRLTTGIDYNPGSETVATATGTFDSGDMITVITKISGDVWFNLPLTRLSPTVTMLNEPAAGGSVRVFQNGQKLREGIDWNPILNAGYVTGLTIISFPASGWEYLVADGVPSGIAADAVSGWNSVSGVKYENLWLSPEVMPTGHSDGLVSGVRLFCNGVRTLLGTGTNLDAQVVSDSGFDMRLDFTTSESDVILWDNFSGYSMVNATGWYAGGGPSTLFTITGQELLTSQSLSDFILDTGDSTFIYINGQLLESGEDYTGGWHRDGVTSKLFFSGSGLSDWPDNTLIADLIYTSGIASGQEITRNFFIPLDSGLHAAQTEIYARGVRLTSGGDYYVSGYNAVLSGIPPVHCYWDSSETGLYFDTTINMSRAPSIDEGYVAFYGDATGSISSDGNPALYSVYASEDNVLHEIGCPVQLVGTTGYSPHLVRHDDYTASGQIHTGIHWFPPHLMMYTWTDVSEVYSSQPFQKGTPAVYLAGLRMFSGTDYDEVNSNKITLDRNFGGIGESGDPRGISFNLDFSLPMFSGTVENAKQYWTETFNDTGIPLHDGKQSWWMTCGPCHSGTLRAYRNGLLMREGSGHDFASTSEFPLASIAESLSFDKTDRDTIAITRKTSVRGIASETRSAIDNAKSVVSILTSRFQGGTLRGNDLHIIASPILEPIIWDALGQNYVTSRRETHDVEAARIDIEETLEQNTQGPFQHRYKDVVEITQEGVLLAREEGEIHGYGIGAIRNTHAEYGYEHIITGAFTRLQSTVNNYEAAFGSTTTLINQAIINTKRKNEQTAVISYDIQYSDSSFSSNVANQTVKVTDEGGGEFEVDLSIPGKEDGVITQKIGTVHETTRTIDVDLQGFNLKLTGIGYGETPFTNLETTAKDVINTYSEITGSDILNARLISYRKSLVPQTNRLSVSAAYAFTRMRHAPFFVVFNDSVFLLSGSQYHTSDGFLENTLELYENGLRIAPSNFGLVGSEILTTSHPYNGFTGSIDTSATIADYRQSWSDGVHIGEDFSSTSNVKRLNLANSLASGSSRIYVSGFRQTLDIDYTEDLANNRIELSRYVTGDVVVDYDSVDINRVFYNQTLAWTEFDTVTNRTFTMPVEMDDEEIRLYKNGRRLAADTDFSLSNRTIIMADRVTSADTVVCDYVGRASTL